MMLNIKDLELLSKIELQEEKLNLDSQIDAIKGQLERHALAYHTTGKRANPEWWRKANIALRTIGKKSQAIQIELSKRKIKSREHKSVADYFVDLARIRLHSEVFENLLEEAKSQKKEEECTCPYVPDDEEEECKS